LATSPTQTFSLLEGRDPRIALDCRWLGIGGTGRATELLLGELRQAGTPGRWLLWGDPQRLEPLRGSFGEIVPRTGDPRRLLGQRDLLAVPAADVVVYLHQMRPLRPGLSVTWIHDVIPLRHARPGARQAKRLFVRAAVSLSARIVTPSASSKAAIVEELAIDPARVAVVGYPVDWERAQRIAGRRAEATPAERLLYVGRAAPHKNLARLVEAFRRSAFAAAGGELALAGADGPAGPGVAWLGVLPEVKLDELLATSRALIAPALEEGYGLPAFEAAASGLPVAAGRTGAMAEIPGAVLFDPVDTADIRRAIDEATAREPGPPVRLGAPAGALREGLLRAIAEALA
jgi:glycosyltransferase involved in cell wall biosynthesis